MIVGVSCACSDLLLTRKKQRFAPPGGTTQVVKGVVGKLVTPEDCANLAGRVVMEHPDKLINNFTGKLILQNRGGRRQSERPGSLKEGGGGGDHGRSEGRSAAAKAAGAVDPSGVEMGQAGAGGGDAAVPGADEASEPISADMLLLRGCVLRNTRWVLGLVLNTGPDTKIMMSMSKVRRTRRDGFNVDVACVHARLGGGGHQRTPIYLFLLH